MNDYVSVSRWRSCCNKRAGEGCALACRATVPIQDPCGRAAYPAGPPRRLARDAQQQRVRVRASDRAGTRTERAALTCIPAWARCSGSSPGRGWRVERQAWTVSRMLSLDPALDSAAARTGPSPSRRRIVAASGEVAVSRAGATPAAAIFGAPRSSAIRLRFSIRNDPLAENSTTNTIYTIES